MALIVYMEQRHSSWETLRSDYIHLNTRHMALTVYTEQRHSSWDTLRSDDDDDDLGVINFLPKT